MMCFKGWYLVEEVLDDQAQQMSRQAMTFITSLPSDFTAKENSQHTKLGNVHFSVVSTSKLKKDAFTVNGKSAVGQNNVAIAVSLGIGSNISVLAPKIEEIVPGKIRHEIEHPGQSQDVQQASAGDQNWETNKTPQTAIDYFTSKAEIPAFTAELRTKAGSTNSTFSNQLEDALTNISKHLTKFPSDQVQAAMSAIRRAWTHYHQQRYGKQV